MAALDNGVPSRRPDGQVRTSLETLLGLSGAPAAEMEFSLPSPPRNHGAGTPVGTSGWLATAASPASCSTPSPWASMSVAPSGWYRARRARLSRFATAAARGQVVTDRQAGLRHTTYCTGSAVGLPTLPISSFSVIGVTRWLMMANGSL